MSKEPTATLQRVYNELVNAGISRYSLQKHAVKLLPQTLRDNEHIEAAVVGRNAQHWSALLVVTDKRILYIEADILFHSIDEVKFEAAHGIEYHPTPLFNSLTLLTRAHNYSISMVSNDSAKKFLYMIEDRIEKVGDVVQDSAAIAEVADDEPQPIASYIPTKQQRQFIAAHSIAVLATASRTGDTYCAPVFYIFDGDTLYIMTREKTHKAMNMKANSSVALTILNSQTGDSLELRGTATIVQDATMVHDVYDAIAAMAHGRDLQPKLRDVTQGNYAVFRIALTSVQ